MNLLDTVLKRAKFDAAVILDKASWDCRINSEADFIAVHTNGFQDDDITGRIYKPEAPYVVLTESGAFETFEGIEDLLARWTTFEPLP